MASENTSPRKSPVKVLLEFGQSPWLDFIQRRLLTAGDLERMIADWGLRGLTSNPVIFEKAIAHTHEYDRDIAALAKDGSSAEEIYETLAVQDVQQAADLLLPAYESSDRADGFANLEVSPHKAHDAEATVAEAKRLWASLGRRNVMIKVPGTTEGLVALRALLAEGINVNVTLLFSVNRYREVLQAHLDGLEAAIARGRDPARIASVASFFLSRIDTMVDAELDRVAAAGEDKPAATSLRGEAAIASARLAYSVFEEFVAAERFRNVSAHGARPQRLLWASTGVKDAAYSDVKYVEALIGPLTVNTMPLETMRAYDDHGNPAARLAGHLEDASATLSRLEGLGIDLEAATEALLEQGIVKFVEPYDALIGSLEAARRSALARPRIGTEQRMDRGA